MIKEKTIRVLKKDLHLTIYRAIVIQSNEYSRSGIFAATTFFPIKTNIVFINVIFQLTEINEQWSLHAEDLHFPIYREQEVDLITINKTILGYVDLRTGRYYYTTRNLYKDLGLAISKEHIWLIGIIGAILMYFVFMAMHPLFFFVPVLAVLVLFFTINYKNNETIIKSIDAFMKTEYRKK